MLCALSALLPVVCTALLHTSARSVCSPDVAYVEIGLPPHAVDVRGPLIPVRVYGSARALCTLCAVAGWADGDCRTPLGRVYARLLFRLLGQDCRLTLLA